MHTLAQSSYHQHERTFICTCVCKTLKNIGNFSSFMFSKKEVEKTPLIMPTTFNLQLVTRAHCPTGQWLLHFERDTALFNAFF